MKNETGRKKIKLSVEGIDCASCVEGLESTLLGLDGIERVNVNLMSSTITVLAADDNSVDPKEIIKRISQAGYTSNVLSGESSTTFSIEGMDCADESSIIEKKLLSVNGILDFRFNLVEQNVIVTHTCETEDIKRAVKSVGFKAEIVDSENDGENTSTSFFVKNRQMILTAASGVLLLAAIFHGYIHKFPDSLTYLLYIPAIVTGGALTARKGWTALKNRSLDMNCLMVIAVTGAAAIGEWQEAAMVVFLFSLANLLETYSMDRARRAIRTLMQIAPNHAAVRRNGAVVDVDVKDIEIGEVVLIKPGEKIPMDGEVVRGNTYINQAPITGESLPVKKEPGDEVFAGTLNERGTVELRVTKLSKDTTLSRIIHMIEEAQSQKAPSQKFVDRFAKYYTPLVILASLLVVSIPPLFFNQPFTPWIYRALVLLVIACPCALVISTPVAIVTALSTAARNGVLIKGGVYLEAMGHLKAIAFDKTGTLTHGVPRVVEIIPVDEKDVKAVLRVAAALESRSEHHLGKAILEKAVELGVSHTEAEEFEAITGKGAKGTVEGELFYIGNHRLFEEMGFCDSARDKQLMELEGKGQTVVLVGNGQAILGLIAIADDVREISREALKKVKEGGIQKTIMLTGDNLWTAQAIAEKLDIDEIKADLLPEDKLDAIKTLLDEYGTVAMVGDGVNDAPALAASTIGIAMGTAGTDAALETADIALMSDDLRKLPYAIKLSRKTLYVIKQNIILSLLIKVVFLIAAVGGIATLWMAVFADMGASLIVIINSLRLIKQNDTSG